MACFPFLSPQGPEATMRYHWVTLDQPSSSDSARMGLRMGISKKPLGNSDVLGHKELLPTCTQKSTES